MGAKTAEVSASGEVWISPRELAKRLGVSRRTIDNLSSDETIKGMKVRGQVRYLYSEVLKQLESAPQK
jgi:excisionase family DNA binding protein